MYELIDIERWNRKEVFHFFSSFEEPYFGITALVDVTQAYNHAKSNGISFFLYYLHCSLLTINQLDPLKLRVVDDKVFKYDLVHASATVNRDDGTFGFSFMIFDQDINIFIQNADKEIRRIRSTNHLFPERDGLDAVHFSSLPWINFTSLSHARLYSRRDSVPKVSFGKVEIKGDKRTMPCSIHVHHGLVDGKDVGDYFQLFQELLDKK